MSANQTDIAIIGAGIIGLSCAWELSKRGARVTIYEKSWPPRGASWAAAGMLAPAYEAAAEEGVHPRLFDLCMASRNMWQTFAAELEAASGVDLGYNPGPSLAVATSESELEELRRLQISLLAKGIGGAEYFTNRLSTAAPGLSSNLIGGLVLPTDGQVDNRRVVSALEKIANAFEVDTETGSIDADIILRATGWQGPDVSPVKGQALSLEKTAGAPQQVIHQGGRYIVPKSDRIIIGATEEPGQSDTSTSEDDIAALYDWAKSIAPALQNAEKVERWSGVRPMSRDRAPMLGRLPNGEFIATGHYRNGILLAPITAKIMADMILENKVSELASAFSPGRFAAALP